MPKRESGSDIWINVDAVDFMQATNEEIDYLKQLRLIQSQPRDTQLKKPKYQFPSMIIDDFLYHGTIEQARNVNLLETLYIRHIINISDIRLRQDIVNKYEVLWINLQDDVDVNIREHFDRTNEFLHTCRSKNQRVLVHCRKGVSRSSSIVLAYLLKYHHDTLHDAYDHLVERRCIAIPNDSFFLQLIRYEMDLHRNNVEENSSELINPEIFSGTVD